MAQCSVGSFGVGGTGTFAAAVGFDVVALAGATGGRGGGGSAGFQATMGPG
jgi:hypothetical protein